MSRQAIEEGIAALQAGNTTHGEQLLRSGLQSQDLPGHVRAVGYMWLATTSTNRNFQIQCYRAAVEADPSNTEAKSRLAALSLPPEVPPPPGPPEVGRATAQSNSSQLHEFGVEGGPNGIGTAFLVVKDGLLVTPRYVVGEAEQVLLISREGAEIDAQVVRSYPEYDLALIRAEMTPTPLRDMTATSFVPPSTPLTAEDYTAGQEHAQCRDTRRTIPPGWFPTTFRDTLPRSFNGAPLADDRGEIVGMLTRNADRHTGHLYGLHMSLIRRKIEAYRNEHQAAPDRMYCGTCGSRSAAGAAGLYYCEICGATLPSAQRQHRTPHPQAAAYYPTDMT